MIRLVLLLLLTACSRREVTITHLDKATVHVTTERFGEGHEVEVTVYDAPSIVPLLVVPMPFGYRAISCVTAEKP